MRPALPIALFCLGIAFLVGCGGGGSGTSGSTATNGTTAGCNESTAQLTYRTSWIDGGGPSGQSQLISLQDATGTVVQMQILNRQTSGSQVAFGQVIAGTYRILIDLYSQPDAQGAKIGEIRSVLNFCGQMEFASVAGAAPTSITVTPLSGSISVQGSQQFYAAGLANGNSAFLAPGSVQWQALGGVATVNATGIAFGTTPGTGSIRAMQSSTGASGAAALTVTPFQTQTTKWTVLVFLNAANDLFQFSALNVNQMEEVASNPEVRFVLQWKQSQSLFPTSSFNGTRRYVVRPDSTDQIASDLVQDMGTDVDMGRPETLKGFVDWAKAFYPSERTVLIVWNHGNGWHRAPGDLSRAVSYDDETGSSIQIWELKQALGTSQFDIVAWDASLMQMAEVAYEVKDNCKFIAGSEESPPGEGYPYDRIFAKFRDNPDGTTKDLSKAFVDGMLAVPEYAHRKITQSVLDSTKLQALSAAIKNLSTVLIANKATIGTQVGFARSSAQSYSPNINRTYRDLKDVLQILKVAAGTPQAVVTECTAVQAAATAAIVWEGHNTQSPKSAGISIDFSSASSFTGSSIDYNLMQFAQASGWGNWLQVAP